MLKAGNKQASNGLSVLMIDDMRTCSQQKHVLIMIIFRPHASIQNYTGEQN